MSHSETDSANQGRIEDKRDRTIWMRLLYMVGFAILGYFAFWIMLLLAVVQFVYTLVAGTPNTELKAFCGRLAEYVREVLSFVTFGTEEQPFPFGAFPGGAEKRDPQA